VLVLARLYLRSSIASSNDLAITGFLSDVVSLSPESLDGCRPTHSGLDFGF